MRLRDCAVGAPMRVTAVDVDRSARFRLHEMGLHAGAVVRVTQRGAFGARVIDVDSTRYALDAATAAAIDVETLDAAGR